MAVSTDGRWIAAGGEPGENGQSLVLLDDADDGTIEKNFRAVEQAVTEKQVINGLAFSPDGKHLAAACSDGGVRVFDVASGKLVAASKGHAEAVFSVADSPDGKKLLTVGNDAVKVWGVGELLQGQPDPKGK